MPNLAKARDGKLEGLTFPRLAASCPGSSIRPAKSGRDPQDGDIMKNCKKLGALLLALTMVTTSGIMSFADGSIAVDPAAGTTTTTESGAGATTDSAAAAETTAEPVTEPATAPAAETTAEPATVSEQNAEQTESQDAATPDDTGADETNQHAHNRTCWKCHGTGKNNTDGESCSVCGGTGEIPCPADVREGVLESVQAGGTGIVKDYCSICAKVLKKTPISAEDVAKKLAEKITVKSMKLVDSCQTEISRTRLGQIVRFKVEISNKNASTIFAANINLAVVLDEGLDFMEVESGNLVKEESGKVIVQASIQSQRSKTIIIKAQMPDDAEKIGTEYAFSLDKVTVSNVGNEAEIVLPKDKSKSVCLRKYFVPRVGLSGLDMGYYYGVPDPYGGYHPPAESVVSPLDFDELEDFEGKALTFEELKSAVEFPYNNNEVINAATQRKWQCVGFIPVQNGYSVPDFNMMKKNVFSNTTKLGFAQKTIEEVKTYISGKEGILYGEIADESVLRKWEQKSSTVNNKVYCQAVWYVTDKAITDEDVEKCTPSSIKTVLLDKKYAEQPNDTEKGITVTCTNAEVWNRENDHKFYRADLKVIIDETATEDVHINLAEAIAKAADTFNKNEPVQPGDTIYYYLTIVNNSGKTYTYDPGSGVIATKEENTPKDGETVGTEEYAGIGFDGFYLSKYSKRGYSAYARRTDNAPLKELFSNKRISLDDASIGEALSGLGYGDGEGLSPAQITQKYLGNYYLDWTNTIRASKGEAPAKSFQDLTIGELSVFTNGNTGAVTQETCPTVVETLYYFYYGKALTFKFNDREEMSLYDQMVNCQNGKSDLEEIIPAALNAETNENEDKYMLKVKVAGKEVNNAFQNTKFGFRIEFDLKASDPEPDPTPDPEPTPTPTPTPDPTPEPDPTPDPQPLPPDDPLEEPDPTPDPQPLPSDDPLIEDEDPKQPLPEDEPLEDPDQPKTGDESDLALWFGTMILAGGAVVTMRVRRKKED